MKHILKIKRIRIDPSGNVTIVLRSGIGVIYHENDYINEQTGEVLEPLYDEFTDDLVGFIYK